MAILPSSASSGSGAIAYQWKADGTAITGATGSTLVLSQALVGKAITVHQALLQRPKLSRLEHAYVLLCLGLDYKRGGFVDQLGAENIFVTKLDAIHGIFGRLDKSICERCDCTVCPLPNGLG